MEWNHLEPVDLSSDLKMPQFKVEEVETDICEESSLIGKFVCIIMETTNKKLDVIINLLIYSANSNSYFFLLSSSETFFLNFAFSMRYTCHKCHAWAFVGGCGCAWVGASMHECARVCVLAHGYVCGL